MPLTTCRRCGYRTEADFLSDSAGTTRHVRDGTCPNCGAALPTWSNDNRLVAGGGVTAVLMLLWAIYMLVQALTPATSTIPGRFPPVPQPPGPMEPRVDVDPELFLLIHKLNRAEFEGRWEAADDLRRRHFQVERGGSQARQAVRLLMELLKDHQMDLVAAESLRRIPGRKPATDGAKSERPFSPGTRPSPPSSTRMERLAEAVAEAVAQADRRRLSDAQHQQLVSDLQHSPSVFVRFQAARTLGESGSIFPARTIAALTQALGDPDPEVRWAAAWALHESFRLTLVSVVSKDDSPEVAAAAAELLQRFEADDEERIVRAAAAAALVRGLRLLGTDTDGDEAELQPFAPLEDDDIYVRIVAAQVSLERSGASTAPAMILTDGLGDQDPRIRWTAALAWKELAPQDPQALCDETVSLLNGQLRDRYSPVRVAAENVLKRHKISTDGDQ